MPVEKCKLKIDENQHEIEVRGTPMFPCGGYVSNISKHLTGDIPWHWHEEIEVIVVQSGAMRARLNGTDFALRAGDGAFVNANMLHAMQVVGDAECTLHSLVFHPSLISGAAESVFQQRYVRPLLACCALPGIPLCGKAGWQQQAVQCIREAYEAYATEQFGYELIVRERLSHMWYLILLNHRAVLAQEDQRVYPDTVRIKIMLGFLHQHYAEPMNLQRIAKAASISERECLRCFQKTIGMSPMQYALKYRISVAARLLANTHMPITEVCGQTGFDDPSYFSKIFKRWMRHTPTMYRKLQQNCP